MELEQRRYQELLETARECGSAEAPVLAPHGPAACPATSLDGDAFPLSFDYNPSSHGLLSPDASYQPTPLAATAEPGCKYSLASPDRAQGHGGGGGGALEYVPKAVGQPRRYGRPISSSKYVVDNSKPSTDLEYDPLSNFSARLLSRASTKDERAPKRPRCSRGSEPYTPAPKKPCDPFGSCDARFSDSDDDAAVTPGDKPVTTSPPRAQRGAESKAPGKPGSREGPELEEGGLRETKEMAVQCDVEDLGPPPRSPGRPPLAKPSSPARAAPERSSPKEGRPKKKSGVPPTANHKDSVRKTDKGKDGARGRPTEKPTADRRGPQAGSPRHKAERPHGTKKKPSSATPVANSGKGRPERPGPLPSPAPGAARQPPDRMAGKTLSGKLAERKARSLDEGAPRDAPKLPRRALSHAELFGDESEDEDPRPEAPATRPPAPPSLSSSSDSDSDSDSSLGLSAAQGPPKRLKASPPPSSSSSSSGAGSDVDYSALEKEVDFDSDPMEECLRIFNESTAVKTEDKGRLARQVRAGQLGTSLAPL